MTDNKVSYTFELFDKMSSKFRTISKNAKGLSAGMTKLRLYVEELGSSYVRFNALGDAFGRMNDMMQNAIAPGVTFQQSIADLSAITGIAGKNLDELSDYARKVGVSSGLGASQAAEAFKLLASQISVDKIGIDGLKELQKQTVTLAQASGLSMDAAANAMAGTVNQFGYNATEASRIINVLAAGAKYGAAEIPDLAQSFKAVGTVAAAAGLDVEKTAGAIEVLSKANVKGSEAGIKLRNILVKLQTKLGIDLEVTSLSDALKSLQPQLGDTAFLAKTFNEENIAAAQFLIKNADAVDTMTAKVTNTNVATEQAAIRTDTYAEKMKRLRARFDDMKISLFNATGGMAAYFEVGAKAMQQISLMIPAMKGLKDLTLLFAGSEETAAVATGSHNKQQKKLNVSKSKASIKTAALTGVTGVFTAMTGFATLAVKGLSQAIKAIPVFGWIAAAIGAAVAAFTALWNRSKAFRATMFGIWEVVKKVFGKVWALLGKLWPWIKKGFSKLVSSYVALVKWWWKIITWPWKKLYNFIKPVLDKIRNLFSGVFSKIGELITKAIAPIKWLWEKLMGTGIVQKVADTFNVGYKKGEADYNADHQGGAEGVPGFPGLGGGAAGAVAGDLQNGITTVAGGGKSVKNFTVNLDSLIRENNNVFQSAQADPEDFMDRFKTALMTLLNDMQMAVN